MIKSSLPERVGVIYLRLFLSECVLSIEITNYFSSLDIFSPYMAYITDYNILQVVRVLV